MASAKSSPATTSLNLCKLLLSPAATTNELPLARCTACCTWVCWTVKAFGKDTESQGRALDMLCFDTTCCQPGDNPLPDNAANNMMGFWMTYVHAAGSPPFRLLAQCLG